MNLQRLLAYVLLFLVLPSCGGPKEGPMGIHVGDHVKIRGYQEVVAVGEDWIEVKEPYGGSKRFHINALNEMPGLSVR